MLERLKQKRLDKLKDIAELYIWKRFVKYNRVKYAFLYGLGVLTGICIGLSFVVIYL